MPWALICYEESLSVYVWVLSLLLLGRVHAGEVPGFAVFVNLCEWRERESTEKRPEKSRISIACFGRLVLFLR